MAAETSAETGDSKTTHETGGEEGGMIKFLALVCGVPP